MSMSIDPLALNGSYTIGVSDANKITLRSAKGSPLDFNELDDNFASITEKVNLLISADTADGISVDSSGNLELQPTAASKSIELLTATGTIALVVDDNARVGIGTEAPLRELEINSTSADIRLADSDATSVSLVSATLEFGVGGQLDRGGTLSNRDTSDTFRSGWLGFDGDGDFKFKNLASGGFVFDSSLSEPAIPSDFRITDLSPQLSLTSSDTSIAYDQEIGAILGTGYDSYAPSTPFTGAKIAFRAGAKTTTGLDVDWDTNTNFYWPTSIDFHTQAATATDDIAAGPRMTIASDGNVGVGIASPDSLLHLRAPHDEAAGAGRINNLLTLDVKEASGQDLEDGDGVGILFKVPYEATTSQVGARIGAVRESGTEGNSKTELVFEVSNNDQTLDEAVRIDADGIVGINNTTPTAQLSVHRSDQNTTGSAIEAHRSDASTGIRLTAPILNAFNGEAGKREVFRVQGDGRVGIGTDSTTGPQRLMQLRDTYYGYTALGFKGHTRFTGADFVNSGGFVIGNKYRIETLGTVDFTTLGASNNTVGEIFTATAIGSGGSAGGVATNIAAEHHYSESDWTIYNSRPGNTGTDVEKYAQPAFIGFHNNDTGSLYGAAAVAGYKMAITKYGNVGIGTTTPDGTLQVESTSASGTSFYLNNTYDAAINGNWRMQSDIDGGFKLGVQSSSFYKRLIIDNQGKVGIGTDPGEVLHIKATGATLIKAEVDSNSVVGLNIKKTGTTTQEWKIADGTTTNGVLGIYDVTDTREVMSFDGDGNVGIGTPSPAFNLDLGSDTSGEQLIRLRRGAGDTNQWSELGYRGITTRSNNTLANDQTPFFIDQKGSDGTRRAITVDAIGNVGIGTDTPRFFFRSNPNTILQIEGENNPELRITDTDPAGGAAVTLRAEDASVTMGAHSNDPLYIVANNSTKMTVLANGNVGIGETAPVNKLEIGDLGTSNYAANALAFGDGTNFGYINANTTGVRFGSSSGGGTGGSTIAREDFGWYSGQEKVMDIDKATGDCELYLANSTFNNASDYRMKENITPVANSLDRVSKLKPSAYKWKDLDASSEGFIAHELAEVLPFAVRGEKDAVKVETRVLTEAMGETYIEATEAIEEVTEVQTAQKTEVREKTVTKSVIEEVDGKYIQTTVTETKEELVPIFEEVPLYGEDGEQLTECTCEATEAIYKKSDSVSAYEEDKVMSEAYQQVAQSIARLEARQAEDDLTDEERAEDIIEIEKLRDDLTSILVESEEVEESVDILASPACDAMYVPVTHSIAVMESKEVVVVQAVPAKPEEVIASNISQADWQADPSGTLWRETTPAVMEDVEEIDAQSVNYSAIIPVLVGAIQELTAKVQELESS
jgi:hypothetical protein